jgi:hypothetical protein
MLAQTCLTVLETRIDVYCVVIKIVSTLFAAREAYQFICSPG